MEAKRRKKEREEKYMQKVIRTAYSEARQMSRNWTGFI